MTRIVKGATRLPSLVLAAALAFGATTASARTTPPTADDMLQHACYPDVQRLCKDAMPDEKKVTACMKRHKAQISKTCSDAYRKVHGKR